MIKYLIFCLQSNDNQEMYTIPSNNDIYVTFSLFMSRNHRMMEDYQLYKQKKQPDYQTAFSMF